MGKCKNCKYKEDVDDGSILESLLSMINCDDLKCGNFRSVWYGDGRYDFDSCHHFEEK